MSNPVMSDPKRLCNLFIALVVIWEDVNIVGRMWPSIMSAKKVISLFASFRRPAASSKMCVEIRSCPKNRTLPRESINLARGFPES